MKKEKNKVLFKKKRHGITWIIGLLIVLLTIAAYKLFKMTPLNIYYFILVLIGIGIFYIGAFLLVKNPYLRGIKYIRESVNYIYLVIFLFFLFAVFGFVFSGSLTFIDELLRDILLKAEGLNMLEMVDFIFFNNFRVSFWGLFLGIFLGIFSLINVVSNGVVLGYVFSKLADASRLGEFWRIFPHGIFELPAVFISLALGIKLGMFIFAKNKSEEFSRMTSESLVVFVFYVVPLLIVAAIIEGILIGLL